MKNMNVCLQYWLSILTDVSVHLFLHLTLYYIGQALWRANLCPHGVGSLMERWRHHGPNDTAIYSKLALDTEWIHAIVRFRCCIFTYFFVHSTKLYPVLTIIKATPQKEISSSDKLMKLWATTSSFLEQTHFYKHPVRLYEGFSGEGSWTSGA